MDRQFKVYPFSIRLAHNGIHAQNCSEYETMDGTIGEITLDITIERDVPERQRARVMETAGKCPVHQTLTHEIKIRSNPAS